MKQRFPHPRAAGCAAHPRTGRAGTTARASFAGGCGHKIRKAYPEPPSGRSVAHFTAPWRGRLVSLIRETGAAGGASGSRQASTHPGNAQRRDRVTGFPGCGKCKMYERADKAAHSNLAANPRLLEFARCTNAYAFDLDLESPGFGRLQDVRTYIRSILLSRGCAGKAASTILAAGCGWREPPRLLGGGRDGPPRRGRAGQSRAPASLADAMTRYAMCSTHRPPGAL